MKRLASAGGAALAALLHVSAAAEETEFAPLPPGEGAELTYYTCIACHSLRTVTNGRYTRQVWDELLDWMVEEQGMMELEPEDRAEILEYLAVHLAPD